MKIKITDGENYIIPHAPGLLQKVYLFQEQRNVCKREIQRKSIQGKLRVALLQIPERKGGI